MKSLSLAFTLALWTAIVAAEQPSLRLQKRWLFVWRKMGDIAEVQQMIDRFPSARASGYNAVVFACNVPPAKAAELKRAAKENGLDLVAIVMGGPRDHNYVEGVPVKDALFVARGGPCRAPARHDGAIARQRLRAIEREPFQGLDLAG